MSIMEIIEKGKKARAKKERTKALKSAAIGATIGVTVGAAAGVLLAPKAGKETRDDIAKAARELPEKAKVLIDRTVETVEEVKDRLVDRKAACEPEPDGQK